MHIVILAIGTRGDVQPTLALSKGLQAKGHEVTLVAGRNFADWIESSGVKYGLMDLDMQSLMASSQGQKWSDHGNNPLVQYRNMKHMVDHNAKQLLDNLLDACKGADVIVGGIITDAFAHSLAQKRDIPHISAMLQPMRPTKYGTSAMISVRPKRNSFLNRWGGYAALQFMWAVTRNATKILRSHLDLPRMTALEYSKMCMNVPTLLGFSKYIALHPEDYPDHFYTTGHWFLDDIDDWTPPEGLLKFLDSGEKPVYIGFGSMSNANPQTTTRMIIEALQKTGARGIISKGWAGLSEAEVPDSIYMIDSAPHQWLFPRMAAVIHHGGAGTMAEGVRAGVPNFVIPSMADQPYWGRRMYELGVGPKPVSRPRLNSKKLANAIEIMLTDQTMKQNAIVLGKKVDGENGVQNAIQAFEDILAKQ